MIGKWRIVATTHQVGEGFDFGQYDRTKRIRELTDEFVTNPSRDGFKPMWNRMNAASQRGNAEGILLKWDGSIDELAALIETVCHADQYESAVDHLTVNAEHGVEIRVRLEGDQLFNVIDKVDQSSIDAESTEDIVERYEAVLEAKDSGGEAPHASLSKVGSGTSTPYRVNKSNQAELTHENLPVKVDDVLSLGKKQPCGTERISVQIDETAVKALQYITDLLKQVSS